MRCQGKSTTGKRCRLKASSGRKYCHLHTYASGMKHKSTKATKRATRSHRGYNALSYSI